MIMEKAKTKYTVRLFVLAVLIAVFPAAACGGNRQPVAEHRYAPTQVIQNAPITVEGLLAEMTVSISCTCLDFNKVGNEWGKYFFINDSRVDAGDVVTVQAGEVLTLYTEIIEYDDKYPEWDTAESISEVITADDLATGFEIMQQLYVIEIGGRYKGNVAEWTVIYTFYPAETADVNK